ncbi:MAG TPA: Na+ dependent nucleoside transporter [Phaeodactylibacter sp.]|nr:Na+ dependent nucleoside transporter [Phaeodactylibacter sp.]
MGILVDFIRGFIGIGVLLGICYWISASRKDVDWGLVGKGIGMQFLLAVVLLYVPYVDTAFEKISSFFVGILDFSAKGAEFLFGSIVTDMNTFGFIFAFQVLPTIVFFAAFSAILYYLGILQVIVYAFAWIMKKLLNLSGSESLAAAANVFIGQTEAPLVVKPYLESMTKSELLCLMTGGMATIAGAVFAAYVGLLGDSFAVTEGLSPEAAEAAIEASRNLFAKHLLMASIISAPAAIVAAKIIYPELTPEKVVDDFSVPKEKIGSNLLEAISIGTTDGIKLAVNVGAMLLVFTALVAMVNYILSDMLGYYTPLNGWVSSFAGWLVEHGYQVPEGSMQGLNLEFLLGMLFAPISWLLGVPSSDVFLVAQLLGTKTVLNEFFGYLELANYTQTLSPKAIIIATYALCGFSNFSSIGIQIGGIGAIAPGQRTTLATFGIRALIGGTIACFITAAIAGMLVKDLSF